jgi:anti-sigma factor RsiW
MRNRATARALARRREPQPWLPWVLLVLLFIAMAMMSVAQAAPADQSQAQLPPKASVQQQPPVSGVKHVAPGVLAPRTNPDPGMALATPNPKKFPMPVLKPKSSTGGATVIPK